MSRRDFGGLAIAYDDRLLAPRHWTQAQGRWAAELLPDLPPGDVLELYCGAGQIGLLAVSGSGRRLVGVDVNPVATHYTRLNAEAAGLDVMTRTGSVHDVLAEGETYPLIIADPPWVPQAQVHAFPDDPRLAIDGGEDGLARIRDCVAAIDGHLGAGGVALVQLAPGDAQADAVVNMTSETTLICGQRRYFERGTLLRIDRPVDWGGQASP
jgi:release factor glutamine methyltransferase